MGIEIERKFLLINDNWTNLAKGEMIRQGCPQIKTGSFVSGS